jgi:hypothetical protein
MDHIMRRERTERGIRRLLSSSLSYRAQTVVVEPIVSRRESPDHSPPNPISQRLFSALGSDSMPFATLVKIVAEQLYQEELRHGAGVLDIGLLGSRLFHDEVIRELHAGDGIFWDIKKSQSR